MNMCFGNFCSTGWAADQTYYSLSTSGFLQASCERNVVKSFFFVNPKVVNPITSLSGWLSGLLMRVWVQIPLLTSQESQSATWKNDFLNVPKVSHETCLEELQWANWLSNIRLKSANVWEFTAMLAARYRFELNANIRMHAPDVKQI